jgi:hypothetical protein
MKMVLVGAVGVIALQVLLVGAYLAVDSQDPIILNPESGSLQENGVTMLMFCGQNSTLDGSGSGVLDNVPPDGDVGAWTKGRTVQGDCDIWYHHSLLYNPHSNEACLVGCENDWLERRFR